MRKLIAIDIDGTLFNDKKEISPKTLGALLQIQELGSIIVLASGRPTSGLVPLAKKLQMEKYSGIICAYNGGLAMNCSTQEILYSSMIPLKKAKEFLKYLEQYPVNPIVDDGCFIYTNDANGFQIPYESQSNNLKIKIVKNISDSINFSPAKVLIAASEEYLTKNKNNIIKPFKSTFSFTLSAPFYLEATPIGVNKAKTLEALCKELEIVQSDVIAFGDAENDKEMLEFAGTSVAMGNAVDLLKDISNMVTKSNNEDGIEFALKKLNLI